MPPRVGLGRAASFEVVIKKDAHFMKWGLTTGEILEYMANAILAKMLTRTNQGIDAAGQPFETYETILALQGKDDEPLYPRTDDEKNFYKGAYNEKGQRVIIPKSSSKQLWQKVKRREDGSWIEMKIRGFDGESVTIRSIQDITERERMINNINVRPARFTPKTKVAKIMPSGKKRNGIGHFLRAMHATRADKNKPERRFIATNLAEKNEVIKQMTKAGVVAWLEKSGQRARDKHADIRKAVAEQKRAQRRRKKILRAIKKSAAIRHKKDRKKRIIIKTTGGETSRQAYQRQRSDARRKRRDNRLRRQAEKESRQQSSP